MELKQLIYAPILKFTKDILSCFIDGVNLAPSLYSVQPDNYDGPT